MALEALGAEIPKRLPDYFGHRNRVCTLYSSLCTCCAWWDTEQDKKLPVGTWTTISKLPGVWSPPDNQPHSCEKATTALWKEECFCSVSSYTVVSVPFAWLTLHFQEKLWHHSSIPVRLSPWR